MALCAGIGGLEIGLKRAIPTYRTVCYVEQNPYAASGLAARMAEKALCEAPIWDDLTTFESRPWRGIVDIITAGFPCQPFSVAGERKGLSDQRWIWPAISRIIEEIEPQYVFLENVPGFVSLGLESVLRDLAKMGFDARWGCIAAESVGAPHERERFFLLANSDCERFEDLSGLQEKCKCTGNGTVNGSSWWDVEPDVGRVADGVPSRVDRLKCLGNAVVPAQAELAWRILTGEKQC